MKLIYTQCRAVEESSTFCVCVFVCLLRASEKKEAPSRGRQDYVTGEGRSDEGVRWFNKSVFYIKKREDSKKDGEAGDLKGEKVVHAE